MALSPALKRMVTNEKQTHEFGLPDVFIPSERFHALVERLREINETDDEARGKAIQFALIDIGRIAPESSRSYYE